MAVAERVAELLPPPAPWIGAHRAADEQITTDLAELTNATDGLAAPAADPTETVRGRRA